MAPLSVVTGAFSYTGRHIAARLLARGERVRTLTGHPNRPHPFGDRIQIAPYRFDDPEALARSLEGAEILYNTYWVRFPRGEATFEAAVARSLSLFAAARRAGVRRVVHVSITNADPASALPYFRAKGQVEEALRGSGLRHAILRPTVLFGHGDVLLNNIAYFLRRLPVFAVFGQGAYPLQPVSVEDVADLALAAAAEPDDVTWDAAGPETWPYRTLVHRLARAAGSRARIVSLPPRVAFALVRLLGVLVRDVVLTWEEVRGLMAGLLTSAEPPRGRIRLGAWLEREGSRLGRQYASELARHYR